MGRDIHQPEFHGRRPLIILLIALVIGNDILVCDLEFLKQDLLHPHKLIHRIGGQAKTQGDEIFRFPGRRRLFCQFPDKGAGADGFPDFFPKNGFLPGILLLKISGEDIGIPVLGYSEEKEKIGICDRGVFISCKNDFRRGGIIFLHGRADGLDLLCPDESRNKEGKRP